MQPASLLCSRACEKPLFQNKQTVKIPWVPSCLPNPEFPLDSCMHVVWGSTWMQYRNTHCPTIFVFHLLFGAFPLPETAIPHLCGLWISSERAFARVHSQHPALIARSDKHWRKMASNWPELQVINCNWISALTRSFQTIHRLVGTMMWCVHFKIPSGHIKVCKMSLKLKSEVCGAGLVPSGSSITSGSPVL